MEDKYVKLGPLTKDNLTDINSIIYDQDYSSRISLSNEMPIMLEIFNSHIHKVYKLLLFTNVREFIDKVPIVLSLLDEIILIDARATLYCSALEDINDIILGSKL